MTTTALTHAAPRDALTHAATLLEANAATLKDCHTVNGDWSGDDDARAVHDREIAAAASLRALATQPESRLAGASKLISDMYHAWIDGKKPSECPDVQAGVKAMLSASHASEATPVPVNAELVSMTRMFHAACGDLGAINEALGLNPNDGGAEPIVDAIEELKAQAAVSAAPFALHALVAAGHVSQHKVDEAMAIAATTPGIKAAPIAVSDLPSFPTMLRKMWSGTEVQQWIDDCLKPLFRERHFSFHCDTPTPWQIGEPGITEGSEQEFIVAVRRKHNGKVYVCAATFANKYDDEMIDRDGETFIADGWFTCGADMSGEVSSVYAPFLESGDEVIGWQPLPTWEPAAKPEREAAPVAVGDAKATEQSDSAAQAFDSSTAGLVRSFARALAAKLFAAQIKHGYGNSWLDDDWEEKCGADLMKHIAKGDPLDVAAYCAFMWHHNWSTAPLASQAAPDAAPAKVDAWIRMDHLRQAQRAPFLCRVEPNFRPGFDLAPIYLAALSQPGAPAVDGVVAQGEAVAVELSSVAEVLENGDGYWRSCSGCHETNEGYETGHYPYSGVLKCHLGGGCSECGGIGAVWDTTDYDAMAAVGDAHEIARELASDAQATAAHAGAITDAARDELRNIANAKRFDRDHFPDDTEFANWAQNRARHALAATPTPSAATTARTHTTTPGESVMGIALRQCGNEDEWRHILACNPKFADLLPSDYFPVGTVLILPPARDDAKGDQS